MHIWPTDRHTDIDSNIYVYIPLYIYNVRSEYMYQVKYVEIICVYT